MKRRLLEITFFGLIAILFASCSSNKRFSLEQYARYPVKFAKQMISDSTTDFTLYIPKNWDWKVEDYDAENVIFGIDASSKPDKNGFVNFMSIQKSKSFGNTNDIRSEFEYMLDLLKNQTVQLKIVDSGKTDLLKQPAFFIHTKSETGTPGEAEIISFIVESELEGVFYYLNASASQTEDLTLKMSTLIQSLMTFKRNSSNEE